MLAIADALIGRRVLLVLDDCEHVLDAVVDLALAVTERSDAVQVMATSREALGCDGELVILLTAEETALFARLAAQPISCPLSGSSRT